MASVVELYSRQMSSALTSLAETPESQTVSAAGDSFLALPATVGAVQVVNQVPIFWNWAPTAPGIMDLSLFTFCDTIPLSNVDGAPFFSGTASFSSNYRSFVSTISSAGAFASIAADAAQRIIEPLPSASTPPGWARVAVNNILEWRPVWSPQLSPSQWMAGVVGSNPTSRTIEFDLSGAAPSSASAPEGPWPSLLPLLGSSARNISITAKAWGRIPIVPGDWFSTALVTVAAQSDVFQPWTSSMLFGAQGLLRYRISEFFAAYSPELSMTVGGDVSAAVTSFLATAKNFVFGGMAFSGGAASVPRTLQPEVTVADTGTTITGKAASPYPQIVAVIVSAPDA